MSPGMATRAGLETCPTACHRQWMKNVETPDVARNGDTARLEARATSGTLGIEEITGLLSGELRGGLAALLWWS